MNTHFYDPLQWTKELAFWPDEVGEANCFDLPDACPWTLEQTLDHGFFPG